MRGPDAGTGQQKVDPIDPASVWRLGRNAQSGDEGDADRGNKHPVQENGPVISLALSHLRTPPSEGSQAAASHVRDNLAQIRDTECALALGRAVLHKEPSLHLYKLPFPQDQDIASPVLASGVVLLLGCQHTPR